MVTWTAGEIVHGRQKIRKILGTERYKLGKDGFYQTIFSLWGGVSECRATGLI